MDYEVRFQRLVYDEIEFIYKSQEHLRKQAWKDHIDNWRKKNRSSIEDANPEVEKINVSCAKWRRLDVYMEDLKFGTSDM